MNPADLDKYKKLSKSSKSNLDKYKVKSTSRQSANQFKKYFLDLKNVFYEDRQSLKQLEETKRKIWIFLPLWFFIAFSYMLISRIKQYEGYCLPNATCKVFIRCNPGYELSSNGKQCQVKKSIIDQIENVCKFQIQNLRYQFGYEDCSGGQLIQIDQGSRNVPIKPVREFVQTITKDIRQVNLANEIQRRIFEFLMREQNQKTYEFVFQNNIVIPKSKKYSFSCWLTITSKTTEFKLILISMVIFVLMMVLVINNYKNQKKAEEVYEYLREKVLRENKVNVSLLQDEMKSLFGDIDEKLWVRIDGIRKNEAKIGFYEEEFLFWQLI